MGQKKPELSCPSSANLSGILASLGTKASASKNSCGSTSTAAPSVTASAAPGAVPSATPTPTETSETVKADSLAFEQQVAALVNQQRAANGLSPLTLSAELSDVARLKSQDMITDDLIGKALRIATGRKIKDTRAGLGYTCVLLDNGACGLAYTFRNELGDGCGVLPEAGNLIGADAAELIPWSRQTTASRFPRRT